MADWVLTVGLEIHVELETKTKMFCGCPNDPFNSRPNTNVCPVCYGLPGALPLLNRRAIEMTVQLGRALNGTIESAPFWARKNYFYPDLPKGYQISQSTAPLVTNAVLVIDNIAHRINRIHLEEDAGKSMHTPGRSSLVNYNRAGVPLLEMVTEPDFHSAEGAKHFCQELQRVMRHLNLSSADMEKGQMRCEANISVAPTGAELGTKVEVKNLNSFRSVERAIMYEYDRQIAAIEAGETIRQETRLWDEKANRTAPMRGKETSADYRYFPEPDLPVVEIPLGSEEVASVVLPDEQRTNLRKLGIAEAVAKIVVDRGEYDSLMETYAVASSQFKVDEEVKRITLEDAKLRVGMPKFAKLSVNDRIELLITRERTGWAKSVIEEMIDQILETGQSVSQLASQTRINEDEIALQVVKENPKPVEDYRAGKDAALNYLVGQVMAKTKGRVNVNSAREAIKKALSQ